MAMRFRSILALALLPAGALAADPAVDKVMDCMRANIPPTVRIQTVEIQAFDRSGGERVLKGKLYGTRDGGKVRTMMRIEAPPDLKDASYLVREGEKSDEMYLYLPSINKVRRITGAAMDGQLWGTDLSYNDLKQLQNAFSGAGVTGEPDTQYEQRPAHVLSFTPRKEDGTRYNRIRTVVDQQTCVALFVEFFEPSGVRKTVTVHPKNLRQSGAHWYAAEADVRDVRNQSHTLVRVVGVTSGDKLASRYFNPQTFYLGN